jgi:uncharacterized membrane protein|tara:strand:+ start:1173 stop:1583 length:411 start_codon:yes stop_codon:yes gene_type:complete
MPGFSKLNDKDFIRAFQVTDNIIQNNQPLFMLIWIGSILSVISTIVFSIFNINADYSIFIIVTGFFYLIGVQGLTISIHIPLNNNIQKIDVDKEDELKLNEVRKEFEIKWNYYNRIRTVVAFTVTTLLMLILLNIY